MSKRTQPDGKRKPGRPRLEVDEDQIRALASIQCTYEEIAAVVGVSLDTIKRNYAPLIKEAREGGKASLRRKQWKLADKSAAMAIFLGKNNLGQVDQLAPAPPLDDVRTAMREMARCDEENA